MAAKFSQTDFVAENKTHFIVMQFFRKHFGLRDED